MIFDSYVVSAESQMLHLADGDSITVDSQLAGVDLSTGVDVVALFEGMESRLESILHNVETTRTGLFVSNIVHMFEVHSNSPKQSKVPSREKCPWVAVWPIDVLRGNVVGPVVVASVASDRVEQEVDAVHFDQRRCLDTKLAGVVGVIDFDNIAVESVAVGLQRLQHDGRVSLCTGAGT